MLKYYEGDDTSAQFKQYILSNTPFVSLTNNPTIIAENISISIDSFSPITTDNIEFNYTLTDIVPAEVSTRAPEISLVIWDTIDNNIPATVEYTNYTATFWFEGVSKSNLAGTYTLKIERFMCEVTEK